MSNSSLQTPVLFLIFNRLDTTKAVFEQIKRAKPSRLYIAADGPRKNKQGEDKTVAEIRKWVIDNINWDCEYKTLFREQNLGCGNAVSSAIDWFFEKEEMGIILEDDCLPDLTFFSFCEDLLIKYKDDSRVVSICGCNTISNEEISEFSYVFSKYSLIWGWATWRRAWKNYDFKLKTWPQIRKSNWLKDKVKLYKLRTYWTYVFNLCYEGKIDTWDYQWIYACWLQNGLSILPAVNLVRNIGIGDNATHKTDERFSKLLEQKMEFPLKHPVEVKISENTDTILTERTLDISFTSYIRMLLMKFKVLRMLKNIINTK